MKKILMSIQPQWVEKILSGEKTIEVRKTAPKPPFKVVMYCTKGKLKLLRFKSEGKYYYAVGKEDVFCYESGIDSLNGLVVGEFVCRYTEKRSLRGLDHSEADFNTACVHCGLPSFGIGNYDFIENYANGKDYIYGLHITAPVRYDKPKELGEFGVKCKVNAKCENCIQFKATPKHEWLSGYCKTMGRKPITRPPQSWQYVGEIEE